MTSQITAYRNGTVHVETCAGSEVVSRCSSLLDEGFTLWKVGQPDDSYGDTWTPSGSPFTKAVQS